MKYIHVVQRCVSHELIENGDRAKEREIDRERENGMKLLLSQLKIIKTASKFMSDVYVRCEFLLFAFIWLRSVLALAYELYIDFYLDRCFFCPLTLPNEQHTTKNVLLFCRIGFFSLFRVIHFSTGYIVPCCVELCLCVGVNELLHSEEPTQKKT